MADSATDGEAHEGGAECFGAFTRDVDPELFWNGSTLVAAQPQPHVAASDERVKILGRQQVTGNLLHRKLIEGLVAVERPDHVIAIGPDVPAVVKVQPVCVRIARVVEPVSRSLLAEASVWPAARPPHAHTHPERHP